MLSEYCVCLCGRVYQRVEFQCSIVARWIHSVPSETASPRKISIEKAHNSSGKSLSARKLQSLPPWRSNDWNLPLGLNRAGHDARWYISLFFFYFHVILYRSGTKTGEIRHPLEIAMYVRQLLTSRGSKTLNCTSRFPDCGPPSFCVCTRLLVLLSCGWSNPFLLMREVTRFIEENIRYTLKFLNKSCLKLLPCFRIF